MRRVMRSRGLAAGVATCSFAFLLGPVAAAEPGGRMTSAVPAGVEVGSVTLSVPADARQDTDQQRIGWETSHSALTPDGSLLFVTTPGVNRMFVIDTRSMRQVGDVTVGLRPSDIAVSPDGSRVFVAEEGAAAVVVASAVARPQVLARIPVCATACDQNKGPFLDLAASPAGPRLYVTSKWGASVTVIDTVANVVLATMPMGCGCMTPAVSPDGSRVFAVSVDGELVALDAGGAVVGRANLTGELGPGQEWGGVAVLPGGTQAAVLDRFDQPHGGLSHVRIVDAAALAAVRTIDVPSYSSAMALSGDGQTMFLAQPGLGAVTAVDVGSGTVAGITPVSIDAVDVSVPPAGDRQFAVGDAAVVALGPGRLPVYGGPQRPVATVPYAIPLTARDDPESILDYGDLRVPIVRSRDGRRLWIGDPAGHRVTEMDATTSTVTGSITLDERPLAMGLSPDGRTLYASTYRDFDDTGSRIAVIDVRTRQVTRYVSSVNRPGNLAVSSDGGQLFVATGRRADAVAVVSTSSGRVVKRIATGAGGRSLALADGGRTLYVTTRKDLLAFDSRTGKRRSAIRLPGSGSGLAISADGRSAYAVTDGQWLAIVDLRSRKVRRGPRVNGDVLIASPAGRYVYVGSSWSVVVVDARSGAVVALVPTDGSDGLAVNPAGQYVWSASAGEGTVTVLAPPA